MSDRWRGELPQANASALPSDLGNVASNNGFSAPELLGQFNASPVKPRSGPDMSESSPAGTEPPPDSGTSNGAAATARQPARTNLQILPSSKPFDQSMPFVAVLDFFGEDSKSTLPNGNVKPAHGEISAGAAEANGFNVLRLQKPPRTSLSDVMKDIDARIESGELKLGRGDYLNISLGLDEMPFQFVSHVVGYEVNAENLAAVREQLIQSFRDVANDRRMRGWLRSRAEEIVDSNEAIDKLQARGITIIHSSGNGGPDAFLPEFLNAAVQLSSNRPDGSPDRFSSNHSLTTPADGVVGFRAVPSNPLDPKPIAQQRGEWQMVNSGARYPLEGRDSLAALGTERMIYDPNKVRIYPHPNPLRSLQLPLDPMRLSTALFNGEILGPPARFEEEPAGGAETLDDTNKPRITMLAVDSTTSALEFSDQPLSTAFPSVGMLSSGTSYSNVDWLKREAERLRRRIAIE